MLETAEAIKTLVGAALIIPFGAMAVTGMIMLFAAVRR